MILAFVSKGFSPIFIFSSESCFTSATYSTFRFSDGDGSGGGDGGGRTNCTYTNAVFMLSSLLLFYWCRSEGIVTVCWIIIVIYLLRIFVTFVIFSFSAFSSISTFCGLNESESFRYCVYLCIYVCECFVCIRQIDICVRTWWNMLI